MHIAICDDNMADRKQMERLLKRESDKRAAKKGILYADSFGNANAMLANPMQYDVFYIDMCKTEGVTVQEIVAKLIEKGVQAPIYLCSSDIDYHQLDLPEKIRFIDKPIKTAELSDTLDLVEELMDQAPSMIELRDEKNTFYVDESEIMYATIKGPSMEITLTEERTFIARTSIENLYSQWEMFEPLFPPNPKVICNARYIAKIGMFQITMTDGQTFKIGKGFKSFIQEKYNQFHS